jgi:hypothetical protein
MTDLWAAHQRARFMQPDAWRYMKPGMPGSAPPQGICYQEPAYRRTARKRMALIEAKAERARIDADERAFRYELAALRFELILLKASLHARRTHWQAKAGFDPDQPRAPAGNSDDGQWTGGGGAASGDEMISSILGLAKQFVASGYSPGYLKCLDICSPLLERLQPAGSDRNKYDFHRCMKVCVGR